MELDLDRCRFSSFIIIFCRTAIKQKLGVEGEDEPLKSSEDKDKGDPSGNCCSP